MCHQSVGLIARHAEAAGIPTVAMSSALDITRAVNPPRAIFTDFPLGHTTGKPFDRQLQRAMMVEALSAFETMDKPGSIKILPFKWEAEESWKHSGAGGGDNRLTRTEEPQYQSEEDKAAASEGKLAEECIVCSNWSAGAGGSPSAD